MQHRTNNDRTYGLRLYAFHLTARTVAAESSAHSPDNAGCGWAAMLRAADASHGLRVYRVITRVKLAHYSDHSTHSTKLRTEHDVWLLTRNPSAVENTEDALTGMVASVTAPP